MKTMTARKALDKTVAKMAARIKADYPDAYYGPGTGWCGPGWQALQARMDALSELTWRGIAKARV